MSFMSEEGDHLFPHSRSGSFQHTRPLKDSLLLHMRNRSLGLEIILDRFTRVFYFIDMLRLSTKGQYGVRAMYEIARGYSGGPITIKEISERQEVSVAYLEQILNTLRKAGIINSVKGPGGGYVLSRDPDSISIGAILRELEGPVAITSCLDPREGCMRVEGCVTHLLWKALGENIESFLDKMTLNDLLKGNQFIDLRGNIGKKKNRKGTVHSLAR